MSFFKKLFGGGGGSAAEPKAVKSAEHKGFTIEARPCKEGGQFQLAGVISKEIDGARKEQLTSALTVSLRLTRQPISPW